MKLQSIFLKDMAYRRARVILTTIGVAVLVMLILLIGGIMYGLYWQAGRYVEFTGADIWISRAKSGGVFVGFSLLNPEYILPGLRYDPGLDKDTEIAPLIFAHARPVIHGETTKATIIGYKVGQMGGPTEDQLSGGRLFTPSEREEYYPDAPPPPREVVVSEITGLEIGERIELAGEEFRVVGKVKNLFFVFDTPFIFMDIRNAQDTILQNAIYVNTFLAKTKPDVSPEEVASRINRRLPRIEAKTTKQTINAILKNFVTEPMKGVQVLRIMMWIATGVVVGMITYVTTLEKTREIGVLKAIGASNRYVLSFIIKQVILMSVVGLLLGLGLAHIAALGFPIFVLISARESILVIVVSMLVCGIGGFIAARKAISVDPMIAFRGEI